MSPRRGAAAGRPDRGAKARKPGGKRRQGPSPRLRPRLDPKQRAGAPLLDADTAGAGEAGIRLNRFLAQAGIASRRESDGLIKSGEVRVNGQVVRELGVRVDPAADVVEVRGEVLRPEKRTYVLLNKPKGVVCTSAAREQKARAIDLVAHVRGRLFPVGRLDEDSEGLLILTNDGEFAHRLMHPRFGVPKTYGVLVRGRLEQEALDKARGGVWLSDGRTGGFHLAIKKRSKDRTYLLVTIREGRNREVRRVFARLGYPVLSLKRIRIGSLTLHKLGRGECRFLTPREVKDLIAAAASSDP